MSRCEGGWLMMWGGGKAASATSYVTTLCYTTSVFLHFGFFFFYSHLIFWERKKQQQTKQVQTFINIPLLKSGGSGRSVRGSAPTLFSSCLWPQSSPGEHWSMFRSFHRLCGRATLLFSPSSPPRTSSSRLQLYLPRWSKTVVFIFGGHCTKKSPKETIRLATWQQSWSLLAPPGELMLTGLSTTS